MSGLQRIILIASHLPGVVELKLDGHTNVCGTNASGKTTLQRLVPVFFGELPSKVVPRTRKKFSEFYLPHANSYLIYEYIREEGNTCQVVLIRKDADAVQYRFVDAPFEPEQLLVEVDGQAVALMETQWLQNLKQLGIESSNKLNATSEYRSVIQNDASAGRANSRENVKLRHMAAQYSLVAGKHRVRHIEKLVSAVHAKEGKMDTLRTMLAAIFEEDGLVQPTTTVRNTKAREWITQMRQSMRLQGLHEDFQAITAKANELTQTEAALQQLQPMLESDLQALRTQRADQQQTLQQNKVELEQAQHQFEQAEFSLNGKISEQEQELNAISNRLDSMQNKYDAYLDSDMDQLEKDMRNLPLWREQLDEQTEQYQLLIEQHRDMEQQLLQQKNKLAESLERLRAKNEGQIKQIQGERHTTQAAQQRKEEQLRDQHEQRKEQQAAEFDEQLSMLSEQIIAQEYEAKNPQLSEQERENATLADKRVELAQREWQHASEQKSGAEKALNQARKARDEADNELTEARRLVRLAKEKLVDLQRQLNPESGTLRQFLRDNVEGWEHRLGKVLHAPLLERKDLLPSVSKESQALLGIELDMSVIDSPEYALDEAALKQKLASLDDNLAQHERAQIAAESALQQCHEQVEKCRAEFQQKQSDFAQAEQEMGYAQQAKQRLVDEHTSALKKRKQDAQHRLAQLQTQKSQQQEQKNHALEQLKSDFQAQLLEFRSDWQAALQLFDEQIDELQQQIAHKREQNLEQIKQLEQAFNDELASRDIDPATIAQLKNAIEVLKRDIHRVNGRRDELTQYQDFIANDWNKLRPHLLEQETELKATSQQLRQQRDNLRINFKTQKEKLNHTRQQIEQQLHNLGSFITEIEPLLKSLHALQLSPFVPEAGHSVPESQTGAQPAPQPAPQIAQGDQQERISRCSEALQARTSLDKQLRDQLLQFENVLGKDAGKDFIDTMQHEFARLDEHAQSRDRLPILQKLLLVLESKTKQIIEQGETIGGDLDNFFKVFSDINRKIANQSKRLTDEVADDLELDGIARSEVKILSTVDELNFWEPLKKFAHAWSEWRHSGKEMPTDHYLDALADVVDVLPNNASYNIESLLRLELHLNEGGSDLVITNDRQLLESSSHGMAYLILCKFLLAFTRLLRNNAKIDVHWPIDEIGTLAYHNVEKLFNACDSNQIKILGAFPNPESEVLMLFKHRYLIDKQKQELQKIEPKISRISQRLQASKLQGANA